MTRTAFLGARIFDGEEWIEDSALLVNDGVVEDIVAIGDIPHGVARHDFAGGMLVPGFIDLQVNGGGGVLLNEDRTLSGLRTICSAHYQYGTTALLPTLITDTPAITAETVAAGKAAVEAQLPGFLGLHLEGPHLSLARKGAHDPALIRPMNEEDLANLIAARQALPNLLTTVAAETVKPEQIARLTEAGVVVSIGHSDASMVQVEAAAKAGASMATHLFNAMSQIGNREPGVAGSVLSLGSMSAGLIADGIHVHPETIGIALRAKTGPAHIFLVTDAMSLTGSDLQSFTLNGRVIHRANGALRLEDGTLAGADLTMIDAIKYMRDVVGLSLEEALRMATLYPARSLGVAHRHGFLGQGSVASFVHLSDALKVNSTWIDGQSVFAA
ncbi:N-acetylglucosamine-6-phosphate deacetylase [Paradevosia shaoguanensis]|uniref:N-acetylglucosamine-6-phosphate deacetylase n=1 Tax=Paradevosia shaoguanensis TaxID=1335043 RepID=A0AA41UB55_9HYPH|nr:N-acetylglucosamine-6-phosphate deacetylase [Paradevosia shaoguanensis]MCF1742249.1 N-acetylglucosamine-6-phosphate deacetylase [Paradevosia shaoguanensis]MCI0126732.1 N-acetylglucosamine-6-phosphate deacetylase [Paradevosia shaoguanensis]